MVSGAPLVTIIDEGSLVIVLIVGLYNLVLIIILQSLTIAVAPPPFPTLSSRTSVTSITPPLSSFLTYPATFRLGPPLIQW
jgi:hypothetical protein